MVFREGIETVLFLAAVSLRTSELLNFMGGRNRARVGDRAGGCLLQRQCEG